MYDSFGDGWNGNDFTLTDSTGSIFFTTTLPSGSSGSDSVCIPSGCVLVNCDGGAWQGEVSWDLLDSTGNIVLSGGAPYSGSIGTCVYGCTDPNALNYNPLAHINIGFCNYGCIQSDTTESFENGQGPAWVLDPNNTVDWTNQTGGTSSFNTGPSGAFDGSYYMYTETSGAGSNSEAIMYITCIDPTQWSQLSLVFAYHMYGATMGTLSVDVSPDSGTTWIEEWTLSGDQGDQWTQTFVDLSAYTAGISVRIQAETGTSFTSDIAIDLLQFMEIPTYGCTNPLALNYDSLAVLDDGSCIFTTGCTNPLADNYDSTAVIDDGSCYFSNCTQLTLNMYDSWGDGWNGNNFTMISSNGTTFFDTTLISGSLGSASFCAPYDCYAIACNGGSWQGEVSWDLVDSNGVVIMSGGAPYSDSICLPVITGCMNPLADNYDSTATIDDGFCYFGCIETDTSESFESGLGITWIQDSNDDFDWSNNSGGTSSFNTGPSSAFDGSFYMYTESSTPNYPSKEAIMYVTCVDPTQWTQLSLVFAYHMYGSAMGTLSVDISPDSGSTWIEEWTLSGDQGDQWNEAYVDLSAYTSPISVRLQALTGTSFTSDFGVDLLRFMEMPISGCTNPLADNYDSLATLDDGSCLFGCIEVDTTESFENGQGITWILDPNNDIDWTNRSGGTSSPQTGPSGAYDGSFYMYTEASGNGNGYPNKEAIMYVPCVDPNQWTELSLAFAYHMYGSSMGTLSIDVSTDSGTTWIEEWTLSGDQGNQWFETYVDLSAYTSDISVRVQGVTGNSFRSDISVDFLRFTEYPDYGCTDPFADNYDSTATYDDGSCIYTGCLDSYALNYCEYCNVSDSSCLYYACKNVGYTEDFESNNFAIIGMTYLSGSEAAVTLNNPNAIADTVSLQFEGGTNNGWGSYNSEILAYSNTEHLSSASFCLDLTNTNPNDTITMTFEVDMFSTLFQVAYSWLRVKVDGNVVSDIYGNTSYNNTNLPYSFNSNTVLTYDLSSYSGGSHYITFESANKYGSSANNPTTLNHVWVDNISISLPLIEGCTDSTALNFNPAAQVDNGSCYYDIFGCTDSTALNYNPLATIDDSSCIAIVYGCTDPLALNYSSLANVDDGTCTYCNFGCTDSLSLNYDPLATCDSTLR